MIDNFRHELPLEAKFHVAGHRGLAGGAIWRHLEARGHTNLLGRRSAELDLRDRGPVFDFYDEERPEYVVLAAAKVGGIGANSAYPTEFLSDNLLIQLNILDAARRFGVKRLLFLGSSCIYPKFAPQPISEDALLTGPLESTNDAYAVAKIAGIIHVQALRRQYGCSFISAMPTNLYGPGDNFDPVTAHVLPAMVHKFHAAKAQGGPVQLWGTGVARREFLHSDDLARAAVMLLERYDAARPINVGTGTDVTIRELARLIAETVGYRGEINWDASKPDGTPRKLLDVSRIEALGWKPEVDLADGVADTYAWYKDAGT